MPLVKGTSRKHVRANIRTLLTEGFPKRKAIAIAMRKAGKARSTKKAK
jgi:hypothetical protein